MKRLFNLLLIFCVILLAAPASAEFSQADAILEVIEKRPRWHQDRDEPVEARRARLHGLSVAMADTAQAWTCEGAGEACVRRFKGTSDQLIALLITAGFYETRFARHVHEGKCAKGECDGGKSKSPFQIKSRKNGGVVPEAQWDAIVGADPVSDRAAVEGATLALVGAWKACHHRYKIRGVFGGYGRGRCTARYQVITRARLYTKIRAEYLQVWARHSIDIVE